MVHRLQMTASAWTVQVALNKADYINDGTCINL